MGDSVHMLTRVMESPNPRSPFALHVDLACSHACSFELRFLPNKKKMNVGACVSDIDGTNRKTNIFSSIPFRLKLRIFFFLIVSKNIIRFRRYPNTLLESHGFLFCTRTDKENTDDKCGTRVRNRTAWWRPWRPWRPFLFAKVTTSRD